MVTIAPFPCTEPNIHDFCTYVSSWQIGPPTKDDTLDASQLLVKSKVEISYQSETEAAKLSGCQYNMRKPIFFGTTKSAPRRFMDLETAKLFRFSCDSFSSDGRKAVSAMISDMSIPFSLEKLQWRPQINVPWTALADLNDLINHVFDVANSTVNNNNNKGSSDDFVEFRMCVIIEKRIILPDQDYEAMVRDRTHQEHTVVAISGTIQELIEYQAASGRRLSITELQHKIGNSLREKGMIMNLNQNSINAMVRQIQRSEPNEGRRPLRSSLENALTNKRIEGRDLKLMERCAICLQEVELRLYVSRLPCSHMFHRECIGEWLRKSPCCPLCRFSLAGPSPN